MDRWLQIGLGRMRDALRRLKGHRLTDRMFFATVGAMRALEQTLDPQGIFNPGKIAFGVNLFTKISTGSTWSFPPSRQERSVAGRRGRDRRACPAG